MKAQIQENKSVDVSHSVLADFLASLGVECPKGGEMEVSFRAHVRGTIKRGQDYTQPQTCKTLAIIGVARMAAMMGATRDAAVEKMIQSAIGEKSLCSEATEKLALEIAEEFKARMKQLPQANREGMRTGKLTFEVANV